MKQYIVAVQFKHRYDLEEWGSKVFHYFTFLKDLKMNDLVVVETQHGYSVAKVVSYLSKSNKALRHAIQKVDLDAHKVKIEKDMQLSFVQAELEERAADIKKRKELESLAKEDARMQELISEMDKLLS